MATNTQKYADQIEQEARHSALAEFSRDERRPAVLLLSALVLSALFFGIGLMVGRWTAVPDSAPNTASPSTASTASSSTPIPQPATSPTTNAATNPAGETSSNAAARRFAILIATYDTPEKAQTLIKALQEAGYTDIRTNSSRAGDARPRYSVLVGRFTQDEAREAARRMRSTDNPRLKNAKVIAEQ